MLNWKAVLSNRRTNLGTEVLREVLRKAGVGFSSTDGTSLRPDAAPSRIAAPATAVPERTALGRSGGAPARRTLSKYRTSVQPHGRAATGGESSVGSGSRCPRQLTLADFWR